MRESFPELTDRYLAAYREGPHLKTSYKTGLSEYMHQLCDKHGLRTRAYKYDGEELVSESSSTTEDAGEPALDPQLLLEL